MKNTSLNNKIKNIIPDQIINYFTEGHERSIRAKKNIIASLIIKSTNIGTGLLLVPLVINYLDQTRYGIWLTITSIVSWFGFMNIGLGNGLRNKFAAAKARGEYKKARKYVSTTYAILTIISVAFFSIFLLLNNYLPWFKILNVDKNINSDLSVLALIVFGSFSIKFVIQLINTIIVADQKPAIRDTINLSGKFLTLIVIFLLTKVAHSSLIYLGIAYSFLPLSAIIIFSIYFFNTKYKYYAPSINYVDFSCAKNLMNLGFKFFILQLGAIILMTTDNIIIAQLFGPKQVTPYQISHKYFRLVHMIYIIILTPLWSAITDAYTNKDYGWIKKTINSYLKLSIFFIIVIIIMIALSNFVYDIWIGEKIKIPFAISLMWGINVILRLYSGLFTNFLNGVGKLNLSIATAIFTMICNIPLSILFAKHLEMGITGVLLASNISVFITAILRPIQYYKIIYKNANGMWDK
jgi:O-antigen/teichoic acid export membrane protein